MSDDKSVARSREFVRSLERGLAVIRAFDVERSELTLSEVARATGLTRAAARRFLITLVDLGYVRTTGHRFALRPRVLELGYSYLSSLALPELAQPHLEALVAEVHESSSLSVLDGHDIVYVARVPTRRIMTVAITVGTRFPAYATSMGRVLLAGLSPAQFEQFLGEVEMRALTPKTITQPDQLRSMVARVRSQGYATVDQELEVGLRSMAVPIRAGAEVIAAINLSMHAGRRTAEAARRELLPKLRASAAAIENDLDANQAGPLSRRSPMHLPVTDS